MAHVLAGRPGLEYHGYDISTAMVRPLLENPPDAISSQVLERVHVGDDLLALLPGHLFDVVFTVSVLIHNSPQQAAELLQKIRTLLAPGGIICFIENRPVSISMIANEWHGGCWSHDVACTLAPDMDVDVDDGILADHGVYLLREPAATGRVIRVPGDNGFEPVDRAHYLLRVHTQTTAVVRNLEMELAPSPAELASVRDDAELYRAASNRLQMIVTQADTELPGAVTLVEEDRLSSALDHLPRLAKQLRAYMEAADGASQVNTELRKQLSQLQHEKAQQAQTLQTLAWQLGLRKRIAGAMCEPIPDAKPRRMRELATVDVIREPHAQSDTYEFNAPRDTRFSQQLTGHERVCHVMHKEWFGMRAACGALPGQKLAVSANSAPSRTDVEAVIGLLSTAGVDRLVLHGFSPPMRAWVVGLSAAGFDQLYLVWHGAPVMWVHREERTLFEEVLKLTRRGLLKKVHGMRPGMHPALGKSAWVPQIYNMPPRYTRRLDRMEPKRDRAVAFIPSWNLIHKNLYTNMAAAEHSERVGEIWTLAKDCSPPWLVSTAIKALPRLSQQEMLETMELADVVMNASIVDCHPMVEMEALAAGTPAVRGRLGLDALEDHPYVRLTEVTDPLSIADVGRVLDRTLAVSRDEMDGLISCYSRQLIRLSFERYSEMLGI